MKKRFSIKWIKSTQIRKQRKYRYNAPLHIRQKFVNIHLSKELRTKYGIRAIGARKGDKVKVLRGNFNGKAGTIEKVNLKKSKIYVTGVEMIKKEGSKAKIPLEPSNLMITELNLDDKRRIEAKKTEKTEATP